MDHDDRDRSIPSRPEPEGENDGERERLRKELLEAIGRMDGQELRNMYLWLLFFPDDGDGPSASC